MASAANRDVSAHASGTSRVGDGNGRAGDDNGGAGVREKKKRRAMIRKPLVAVMKDKFDHVYRKVVMEGILRQRPLPPSKDGRHIPLHHLAQSGQGLLDERRGKPFISNFIRSSRYTIINFIPKQLFFQFSRLANFYFLVIGIIQMIPGFSTTGRWTTIGPLAVFVAFSMAKEGYDDYGRYQMDKDENTSRLWVLGSRTSKSRLTRRQKLDREKNEHLDGSDSLDSLDWTSIQWQDVKVGDIVRIKRDEGVPADLVLLHATGPNNIAYVETMALDGETNLKSKQALPILAERCRTMEGLKSVHAMIVSEDPNLDLYSYDGRVIAGDETVPLSLPNILLRGSTLRNTAQAVGLVVNTGEECKIRMNATRHVRAKAPEIQSLVNDLVLFLIVVFIAIASGLYGGYLQNEEFLRNAWYFSGDGGIERSRVYIAFLIMFDTLIPLSLYVCMEIIKIGQLYFLSDIEMYDEKTNTPMAANTGTILENLGQVNYLFSDKTGTLTENIMKFRKLSVAGTAVLHRDPDSDHQSGPTMQQQQQQGKKRSQTTVARDSMESDCSRGNKLDGPARDAELDTDEMLDYIRRNPDTEFSRKARHLILCMALCHTCLPETKPDGEIGFQSASPDELALVEGARDFGYLLIDRPAQSITLQRVDETGAMMTESYKVLDVIEFSSQRKRMSIIIRMPDGQICIFCKGADSIMIPRLRRKTLAEEKINVVQSRASKRRSMQRDMLSRRMSGLGRRGSQFSGSESPASPRRMSFAEAWASRGSGRDSRDGFEEEGDLDEVDLSRQHHSSIDEAVASKESVVFERTFMHVDGFAREGLRTLLFAYAFLDEADYSGWKKKYDEAATSLVDRQQMIEDAAELIERDLELAGVTAIEDRLQEGVPDTIDKLRRAGIKVWMITGDKRETAINIGYSANVCMPVSEVYVLDSTSGDVFAAMDAALDALRQGDVPHSVLVVDGHTLGVVEEDATFYELVMAVDSVVCCRASPSQKAQLVQHVRQHVRGSMTLAIGDGANDIGMIQASHVGVGISGREGLQAARISDYSIAQFRFLQRLLFVHGRWNYLRTGKYILATFWKEIVFFTVQAYYQRQTRYTGTSLYESWSLAAFNAFFTSLPVILMGIVHKDLEAETLLAYPELYSLGQRNAAFNWGLYAAWMFQALVETTVVFYFMFCSSLSTLFTEDNSLYAIGSIGFTSAVLFINIKIMVLEVHNKNAIIWTGVTVSVVGWFLWNIVISVNGIAGSSMGLIRHGFLYNFGQQLWWWASVGLILGTLITFDLALKALRRVFFPNDVDIMQLAEQKGTVGSMGRDLEAGSGSESKSGSVGGLDRRSDGGLDGVDDDGVEMRNLAVDDGRSRLVNR